MRSIANHALCAFIALLLTAFAQAARLTDWATDPSGPFFFRLQCESNEVHLVQRSTNLVDWTIWMRSANGGTNRFIQASQSFSLSPRSFFRALQTNEPVFAYGLAAKTTFDLNGNYLHADSFDSSIAGRNLNGRWNLSMRRDRANISVGAAATNMGNLEIWGNCYLDGAQAISVGPQAAIGSAVWQNAGNPGIQPGHFFDNWPVPYPDVVLPPGSEGWLSLPPGGITNGITYNHVFNQTGDYRLPAGTLFGRIYVSAPNVRLRVDGSINFSGQDFIEIGSSSTSFTIYMTGESANFGGNGILNSFRPTNFVYFGTPSNTALQIGGNGETTAVFYAPSANATLRSGGSGEEEFSGALVANSIRLTSPYIFHFDEGLLRYAPLW